VFWFSLLIMFETLLILKRIQRHTHTHKHTHTHTHTHTQTHTHTHTHTHTNTLTHTHSHSHTHTLTLTHTHTLIGIHLKYSLWLSYLMKWNLNFLDRFSKIAQKSSFRKIRPVRAVLFYADGRTDMMKLILAFGNFVNAPKMHLGMVVGQ
jgi:hypothetical protein